MKYLYTFLAIVLTVGLQAQNTIATYNLDTVDDPASPFFIFGGNENGRTSAHDATEGAWIIGGTNDADDAGAAYIGYTAEIPVYSASSTITVEFDLKQKIALNATAIHLTVTTSAGAVNVYDIQDDYTLAADAYNTFSYDFAAKAGFDFVKIEINLAAGALVGAGGEVYVDNVTFKNSTSHPAAIQANLDASDPWSGYMAVNYVVAGAKGDAQFDMAWGVDALRAIANTVDNTVELLPNTNGYADNVGGNADQIAYWTNSPDGGVTAGDDGNKWMTATAKVEFATTGATAFPYGSSIAFAGNVTAFDLDARYALKAFVKTIDPDNGYALVLNDEHVITATGNFEVSITPNTGHIVQYGFEMQGINANPATDWGSALVGQGTFAFDKVVSGFEISIYPNQVKSTATISADQTVQNVQIYDLTGRVVHKSSPNKANFNLDVSHLSKGVYLVKVNAGNQEATLKLAK
ncbi:MAG: T9SS type A sorting domain-containing protein [Flavobacteriaceae bacterium]